MFCHIVQHFKPHADCSAPRGAGRSDRSPLALIVAQHDPGPRAPPAAPPVEMLRLERHPVCHTCGGFPGANPGLRGVFRGSCHKWARRVLEPDVGLCAAHHLWPCRGAQSSGGPFLLHWEPHSCPHPAVCSSSPPSECPTVDCAPQKAYHYAIEISIVNRSGQKFADPPPSVIWVSILNLVRVLDLVSKFTMGSSSCTVRALSALSCVGEQ